MSNNVSDGVAYSADLNELELEECPVGWKAINLYEIIPHYYWHLITDFKTGFKECIERIMFGARCTCKTQVDCKMTLLGQLLYGGDILSVVYEENNIVDSSMKDYLNAMKFMGWDTRKVKTIQAPTDKKLIWKSGGKIWCIEFENGKGNSDRLHGKNCPLIREREELIAKGLQEEPKWIALLYYELGTFITWEASDVTHINSSILRYTLPQFVIYYEFNRPRRGSGNTWIMDFIRGKMQEQKSFEKDPSSFISKLEELGVHMTKRKLVEWGLTTDEDAREMCRLYDETGEWYDAPFPEDPEELIPSTWEMMWTKGAPWNELLEFLEPNMIMDILGEKDADPQNYDEVYLAKEVNNGLICFPYLSQDHLNSSYLYENWQELHIGVDTGRVDATVYTLGGVNWRGCPLKFNFAIKQTYLSKRFGKYEKDGGIYKWDWKLDGTGNRCIDVYDMVAVLVEFCQECHKIYPDKRLTINIDYGTGDGQAIYDMVTMEKILPDYCVINRRWRKALIQQRIDTKSILHKMTGVVSYNVKRSWEADKNAIYLDKKDLAKLQRKDDTRDPKCDMDSEDSMEYEFTEDEWARWFRMAKLWWANQQKVISKTRELLLQ